MRKLYINIIVGFLNLHSLYSINSLAFTPKSPELQSKDSLCHHSTKDSVKAKGRWVYLHGLDPDPMSAQEKSNRQLLIQLSKDLNFSLLILRSNSTCSNQQKCWKYGSTSQLERSLKYIRSEAETCWGTAPFKILGFSNGGYLSARIYQECLEERAERFIASGSAGQVIAPGRTCTKKLKERRFDLAIGIQDMTFAKAKMLVAALNKNLFRANFFSFEGGHVLNADILKEIIKNE